MVATVNVSFSRPHKRKSAGNIDDGRGRTTSNLNKEIRRPGSSENLFSEIEILREQKKKVSISALQSDSDEEVMISPVKTAPILFTRQSLTIYNVSRKLLMTRIQCNGKNSKTLTPVTASATLDMKFTDNLQLPIITLFIHFLLLLC